MLLQCGRGERLHSTAIAGSSEAPVRHAQSTGHRLCQRQQTCPLEQACRPASSLASSPTTARPGSVTGVLRWPRAPALATIEPPRALAIFSAVSSTAPAVSAPSHLPSANARPSYLCRRLGWRRRAALAAAFSYRAHGEGGGHVVGPTRTGFRAYRLSPELATISSLSSSHFSTWTLVERLSTSTAAALRAI
jgi:hypothetical protein